MITMRTHFRGKGWLACLAIAGTFGCGDAGEGDAGFGESQEGVVGGSNVTNNENGNTALPYGSTVLIVNPEFGSTANFPVINGQPTRCSGVKIGPNRYLTAAHCVDTWNGPFNGQVLITNHPTTTPGQLDSHTVTQVYVHPTWVVKPTGGAYIGRPYDVAMFDVSQTNSIPALSANNSPKINTSDITNGWWSRLVGYGSGRKAWGDNVATNSTGDNFTQDEAASRWTSFFWAGNPGGEPGDSGAPVLNEGSGGWWVSGIVSGQGPTAGQSRMSRAEPLINWIKNPAARTIAAGSTGYLINARGPHCAKSSGNDYVSQWACYHGTSSTDSQYWTLEASGVANRFRIKNGETGKCLAAENNNDGGHLRLQTCSSTSNGQRWEFVNVGALDQQGGDTAPGYRFYQIKSALGPSARCLAPFQSKETQGQLLHYYACQTIGSTSNPVGNPQVWAFTR